MTRITFRDEDGRPVAGAVVAITAAPAEMTDLGYVADGDGSVALSLSEPGDYRFALTGADGRPLTASARLSPGTGAVLLARPAG